MIPQRQPIEYADASAEVRAVYDDIMATRSVDWVNNFWKVLAHDPPTLRRLWGNLKQVMGPGGALDWQATRARLSPATAIILRIILSCRLCRPARR